MPRRYTIPHMQYMYQVQRRLHVDKTGGWFLATCGENAGEPVFARFKQCEEAEAWAQLKTREKTQYNYRVVKEETDEIVWPQMKFTKQDLDRLLASIQGTVIKLTAYYPNQQVVYAPRDSGRVNFNEAVRISVTYAPTGAVFNRYPAGGGFWSSTETKRLLHKVKS